MSKQTQPEPMYCMPVKNGFRIRFLLSGKIFPKLYKSVQDCEKRVAELTRHSEQLKPKK